MDKYIALDSAQKITKKWVSIAGGSSYIIGFIFGFLACALIHG